MAVPELQNPNRKKTIDYTKTMKTIIRKLILCATLLGASTSVHAAPVLFPNGDFDNGNASWTEVFGGGTTTYTYPDSGGNPGGYGTMNNSGGWGIWVGNGDAQITLASLNLTAGETYNFFQDMTVLSGSNVGGLKVDFIPAGSTGDMDPPKINDAWNTYVFPVFIPPGTTAIKIVPVEGANSTVGYDNIGVDNTPVVPPPFVPDQIPNGDFEIPAGANWSYFTDGFGLEYPTTGGNPGGNAIIDGTIGGGYGVLVAFDNAEKTAASLGLTPGGPCTIQMDMKLISGVNVGGLKLEGPAGFVQIIEPAPLAGLGVWATYTFEFTLQNGLNPVTQFKIVPLGKGGSKVAYDNVKIVLPTPPGPLQATIAQGSAVSWTAPSAVNAYQPQESTSISGPWTDLGPKIVGNTVTSVFDGTTSPNYRVLESVPAIEQAVYNGGFEAEYIDSFTADGWESPPGQLAERITTDFRTGIACMQIKAVNGDPLVGPPAESQTSQNTFNANLDGGGTGTITVGNSYTLSFWAKQISAGASYAQEYRVSWLNGSGGEITVGTWQNFDLPVTGTWVEKTLSGLVAPVGATTAFIQITGKLGGVPGVEGEVLIDDVSLLSDGFGSPTPIAATAAPAVEVSWPSTTGQDYQVQSSGDLGSWSDFGGVISGDDTTKSVFDIISGPKKFYKVGELP